MTKKSDARHRPGGGTAVPFQRVGHQYGRSHRMMSAPLDLPRNIANVLSSVVEDFAKAKNLKSESWYHDEPMWIVSDEEDDDGVVREVQVAAFRGQSDDELCFIPHAYAYVGYQLLATEERPTGKRILRLSLTTLANAGSLIDMFKEQLGIAWSRANSLTKSDLVSIPAKKK